MSVCVCQCAATISSEPVSSGSVVHQPLIHTQTVTTATPTHATQVQYSFFFHLSLNILAQFCDVF